MKKKAVLAANKAPRFTKAHLSPDPSKFLKLDPVVARRAEELALAGAVKTPQGPTLGTLIGDLLAATDNLRAAVDRAEGVLGTVLLPSTPLNCEDEAVIPLPSALYAVELAKQSVVFSTKVLHSILDRVAL